MSNNKSKMDSDTSSTTSIQDKTSSPSNIHLDMSEFDKKFSSEPLTLAKMFKLNAIVGGIEFCGSAAFCFIPPMLLKAGIDDQFMSMILGVGPLMSLFFVPLIGRWSDSCQSKYGRRRPYILVISFVLLLSMLTLLSAHYIGRVVFGGGSIGNFTTILLLILGCAFLDFTYQVCLTPCEALLSDLSQGTNQQQSCFTVYSFMISFGGCIGYLITALDWSNLGLYFGSQENCVFIILIIMYSCTVFVTMHAAKEKPLTKIDRSFQKIETPIILNDVKNDLKEEDVIFSKTWPISFHSGRVFLVKVLYHITSFKNYLTFQLYVLSPDFLFHFFAIPKTLKQLALANLFSWTAINTFNIFYTDYIARIIYHGNPYDAEGSIGRELYDKGVRMASWGLFFHCIISALYAPFIDRVIAHFNLQATYFYGMASFFVAMLVMTFSSNIVLTNLCAAITGLGYATITTIPYLLLSFYHDHLEVNSYN